MPVMTDREKVLTRVSKLLGNDRARAERWYTSEPLAGFDGKTAQDLVRAGHIQAVLIHIEMLEDGIYS
jgi:hypothetical protein